MLMNGCIKPLHLTMLYVLCLFFFLSYSLKNINMIFKISSMNFLLLYPELRNN